MKGITNDNLYKLVSAWRRELFLIVYSIALLLIMMFFKCGDLQIKSYISNFFAMRHWNVYKYFSQTSRLSHIATIMLSLYYLTTGVWFAIFHAIHLDPISTNHGLMFSKVFGHQRSWMVFFGLALMKIIILALGGKSRLLGNRG
ncbi:hypothetical protein CO251_14005 [Sulfobacillus sp. hq2]|nr:hypothetical protein CO251_14005 [Sulfobacillus sp. hq2]